MKYNIVALGGTFDRFHRGHKTFISEAFKKGQKVLIGLTSHRFARSKRQVSSVKYQSYQTRNQAVVDFLKDKNWIDRAEIVSIDDIYGPLLRLKDIDALIVTAETVAGADRVNAARIKVGLKSLKTIVIPLVLAQDRRRISSTRIREGEIDRWGKVMKYQISNIKNQISDKLRQQLKKPLGKLHGYFRPEKKESMLITVGDAVTKAHLDAGIIPDLAVVDLHIKRSRVYENLSELGFPKKLIQKAIEVDNPAGWVTRQLTEVVGKRMKFFIKYNKPSIIQVIGEEDLAGLPAILLAPLGTRVFYGQPGEGVVEVEVSEEKKRELLKMIQTTM